MEFLDQLVITAVFDSVFKCVQEVFFAHDCFKHTSGFLAFLFKFFLINFNIENNHFYKARKPSFYRR